MIEELCASEPVHLPGAIQRFGCLIAFDPTTRTITHASDNLGEFFPVDVGAALGRDLDSVLPGVAALAAPHGPMADSTTRPAQGRIPLEMRSTRTAGDLVLLELEHVHAWQSCLEVSICALARAGNINALLQCAANIVFQLTGFDRVLCFRFDHDDHGEVLAEAKCRQLSSFIGHRYPASDIPPQVRALYLSNPVRAVPDTSYRPSRILAADGYDQPLDLGAAILRAVSPVHLEYLSNMGVRASLSVGLVVRGRLWGMISCGHRTAKALPKGLRDACEAIGHVVALQVAELLAAEVTAEIAAGNQQMDRLLAVVAASGGPPLKALHAASTDSMSLFRADGFATVIGGEFQAIGACPGGQAILSLVTWVFANCREGIFTTHHLKSKHADWTGSCGDVCGALVIAVPGAAGDAAIWFRNERIREVAWGGNPHKTVTMEQARGGLRLHPRKSFELWLEQVVDHSLPWSQAMLDMAARLRRALVDANLRLEIERERDAVQLRDGLIREAEARMALFVTLFHAAPTALLIIELPNRTVLKVNDRACDLLGSSAAELIGRSMDDGSIGLQADDRELVYAALLRDGRVAKWQLALRRGHDSTLLPILLDATRFDYLGTDAILVAATDLSVVMAAQASQKAQAVAEAANQSKNEFLARISHELRTPLNAVMGFAQLLRQDLQDPLSAQQAERVRVIEEASRHLTSLIGDVLDVAQLGAGRIDFDPKCISVHEAMDEAITLSSALSSSRGVVVTADYRHEQPTFVTADARRLRQILLNLISNAVKYNRPGGRVNLSASSVEGKVRIECKDTGIGMSSAQLKQLFEPYNRLGREGSSVEGLGLGLSIAWQLVQLMGGQLNFESEVGQGTTARLLLPACRPPSPSAASEGGQGESVMGPTGGTVLYIEDDPVNRLLVDHASRSWSGVALITAETGAQGIQMATAHLPQVIMLDMQLPDMTGLQVLYSLRDDPRTSKIPVLVASASAMAEDVARAEAAGAAGYLTKPLDLQLLNEAVRTLLVALGPSRSS